MDHGENNNWAGSSASRPPRGSGGGDDSGLFMDITPTQPRRAPSYGRPATPASSAPGGGNSATRTSSPYGGRAYAAPTRNARSSPASGNTRQQPRQSRQAPVYTELSWEDLRRGADLSGMGQTAPTPAPNAARPQSGGEGASYFGGFSQEMEELYYNQPARPVSSDPRRYPSGDFSAAQPRYDTAQPRQNSYGSAQPRQSGYGAARTRATAARPQAVSRPQTVQRTADPAPAPSRANRAAPLWQPAARGNTPPPNSGNGHVNYATRPRRQGINPVVYMVGFVLLALVILLVARLVGGKSRGNNTVLPNNDPAPSYTSAPAVPTAPADSPDADATPGATPEITPTPSPEPTPTPSGAKAQRSGNLIVPADWGPAVPERTTAVYDSHFDRACMIGNSLVEGFAMWSGITNMRYIYHTGATINTALGTLDFSPITLNPPGYYSDIYLMFGLNEVGTDVNSFVQSYKKVVEYIREYQPDANIYVISVTPVTKDVDADPGEVQTIARIDNFNASLREFCVDQHCWYLDIYTMLLDGEGFLSADYAYAGDGKHFEKSGYVAWANYMKSHYVDEGLLTE